MSEEQKFSLGRVEEMKNVYGYDVTNEDLSYIAPQLKAFAAPIDAFKQDSANAKNHTMRNLDDIKMSLNQFGQQTPIVVDNELVVRKGNGTLICAKELGWRWIAAIPTNLKDINATAWSIADNKSAESSMWHEGALSRLLEDVAKHTEIDFRATGFTDDEFKALLDGVDAAESGDGSGSKKPACAEQMELQPFEHYDYIVVLADNLNDWEFLIEFFGIKKVAIESVPGKSKIGLGRGIRARKVIEKIKEFEIRGHK